MIVSWSWHCHDSYISCVAVSQVYYSWLCQDACASPLFGVSSFTHLNCFLAHISRVPEGNRWSKSSVKKVLAANCVWQVCVGAGGMLAGHDESAGDVIERAGKKRKQFYGMSSDVAMKKYAGGVAEYRSSEGKCVEVDYRGPVEATVLDLLGGIRSACTYVGAAELKEMSKRTTFVRVTQQLNTVFEKNWDCRLMTSSFLNILWSGAGVRHGKLALDWT